MTAATWQPTGTSARRDLVGHTLHYTGDSQDPASCPLAQAALLRFEDSAPVVKPLTTRGRRANAGLYYAASLRAHVPYQSWLARDEAMALDFDTQVARFAASPFELRWPGASNRAHVPSFFCRRVNGTAVVVDCRSPSTAKSATKSDTISAEVDALYRSIGWTYRLVDGHDGVWLANLQWLAGYRHPRYDVPDVVERLLERFATPTPLMEGVHELGDPLGILPVLYHLLWRQLLSVDLSVPLDGPTLVSAGV